MSGGTEVSIQEIVDKIGDCRTVCITGGEPMLQPDIYNLFDSLLSLDKRIVLETNGAVDLSKVPKDDRVMISMDIKCPSSGESEKMLDSNLQYLSMKDQLKFVIKDDVDLQFALDYIRRNDPQTNMIFGPVGGTDRLEWLVDEVLENNVDVRVLPQLHKIIWGDKRGV